MRASALSAVVVRGGLAAALALALPGGAWAGAPATYRNPLPLTLPDGAAVESCADPTVLKGQRPGDPPWTLICTQDPLNDADRDAQGGLRFRHMPMFRSDDLVHWRYQGEAMPQVPPQATATAGLWAPELVFVDGRYRLYYTITDVVDALSPEPGCNSDSAIGVATSDSPLGPWVPEPQLVVGPRRAGPGCNFHWTFDPELLALPDGRKLLYFGSYGGGLLVQPLDTVGLKAQGEPLPLSRSGRYEGSEVVFKDGYHYLFASSTNCCNADLTGYMVFVGRSRDPLGPFLDRDGRSFNEARIGGTPVLAQNGNRWVGAGHNSVLRDEAGRWWTLYHAVDRQHPQWTGSPLTRRPLLLDPLDWVDGWPVVRRGPSDQPMAAPTIRAGATVARQAPLHDTAATVPRGRMLWRDEWTGARLSQRWRWTRPPDATPRFEHGQLILPTSAGDLWAQHNSAPVLGAALPAGDLWIETRVGLALPAEGDIAQPVQAGLALWADDDRYVKLVHVALHDTRQTEFAIERPAQPGERPRYGNSVVGPPGDRTTLALHVQRRGQEALITAFTRADAGHWVRGGTWVHQLGPLPRLGLLAMGGAGHEAVVDYVRVYRGLPLMPR
ncbi:family 43 glycosylhydrolase [Ideonella sp. BN130291]|uniref:family 43 glycosylhydrolase n=1 Tax=Ideonella sp. BN130291 TaxID=3112940 RepID=UPI002E272FDB|nr:family 43 glycosylhydrolase [Ideonella sp. BN130291]